MHHGSPGMNVQKHRVAGHFPSNRLWRRTGVRPCAPAATPMAQPAAAPSGTFTTVTLDQRPDLRDAVVQHSLALTTPRPGATKDFGWPVFLYKGPGGRRIFDACFGFPHFQALILHTDPQGREVLAAVAYTVPCVWDGSQEGIPASWDAVIDGAAAMLAQPAAAPRPSAVSGLAVEVAAEWQGRGLSRLAVLGMRDVALAQGLPRLLAPVRPVLKPQYPLIPMEEYITWRQPDSETSQHPGEQALFDPWLRVHMRLGGTILKVATASATIGGSRAEWQEWTGLTFGSSGQYVVPGGLVPVEYDAQVDQGWYVEPNVWVSHKV